MGQLQLTDRSDHTFDEAGYMQGVQAKGFEVVDSLACDDAPEIEIVPSFLKIPKAIIDHPPKAFYQRESQALIPYRPPPAQAIEGDDDDDVMKE
ncbi:hypothetical protein B9G98_02466 [Wickerhamiella sorbophila]|uniref:Uncharacterized protein n=1 Tax=Wickerhamiella sorbophila TaxID=45607 RepID=A0A2T0FIQ0_9ASCO|nr:hypothetical protein B9G98_02466 [Wickerhamiella sorbophila]PRT54846.1 hypothetical protein B9G98_02466 [Wickerhamiella sorbophila]